MIAYLDTSAAAKLLVEQSESEALARYLDESEVEVVACMLLATELRRLVVREALPQSDASEVLEEVGLYDMPRSLYYEAGILAQQNLRSLDALHLAAAVRLGVDAVVTYDTRMAEAAQTIGLEALAIGR